MLCERLEDDVGERDSSDRSRRLRGPEVRRSSCRGHELSVDAQLATKKVDSIDRQPQHLTLSEAGTSGEHAGDPVPGWHGFQEYPDLLHRGRNHLGLRSPRESHAFAGFHGQDAIAYSRPEDGGEGAVDVVDASGRKHLAPASNPALHVGVSDGPNGAVAE